ncbi:sulfatase [Phytohabitans sp. ZYX-F-186]|uniref:Sulfatase n=1 Tax=Phytohabitans maris TaxID=3071409 RepID=A0ABU0ZEP2_9ACTN|nr:sulfatase [Phytohabitans sp. ZYX-F-186]MDQ7904775.1 sulfatase [Phytohabitans sp. ZYX-F-186]
MRTLTSPAEPAAPPVPPEEPGRPPRLARIRPVAGRIATVLAWLLVIGALLLPNELAKVTPWTFLRIPIEAVVGIAVLLALPPRPRRVLALLGGAGLGLVTILKFFDIGFYSVLDRPFDPVFDLSLFDPALVFLTQSIGRAGAIGAVVGAVLLVIAVIVLMTLSVLRATRHVVTHQRTATRAAAALVLAWFVCAALGAHVVSGAPLAASDTAGIVRGHAAQTRSSLRDQQAFEGVAAVDAFRNTPGDQLLTALRGKDVIFTFIESYGRDAIEDPLYAPEVGAVLDDGTRRLAAAGFDSRSGFLTSSTAGGGSWMAQATFNSGLWINNQKRYRSLVSSDRLTLTSAFERANWRTVGMMPGVTKAWPEGRFYGYDQVYDAKNVGYQGPAFALGTMPDQYTLSAFQRLEYGRAGRGPLMAEMPLTSSHAPWAPLPHMIDWGDVGDGSVFGPMAKAGDSPEEVWRDADKTRAGYRTSIVYSLNALIAYIEKYGDDNLVLVFLGDHQPAPLLTGKGATHDVPITILTRDRAVLDRISGWHWDPGLKPGKQAPVWRMDTFRDRFLTAYSPPR